MRETLGPIIEEISPRIPSPEREKFVADQVGEAYRTLLTNGGMITNSGIILADSYRDVRSENLTDQQADELTENYSLRIKSFQAEDILPEGSSAMGSPYVFIIKYGTFPKITYHPRKPGGNTGAFFIRKPSTNGKDEDQPIWINPNLYDPLTNYAKRILKDEGIWIQGFPVAQFMRDALKKVIDERDRESELK